MQSADGRTREVGVVGPVDPALMAGLERDYIVHALWQKDDPPRPVPAHLTAIVTDGRFGASASLIESLPALRVIACNGVGVDAIALDVAQRRGVAVTTTPDVLTEDVADMAVALLLAVSRRIVVGDQFARSGAWERERMTASARVSGQPAGIVGLGRIGRAVARRLTAFGMSIAYADVCACDEPYAYVEDLVALARASRFLIVTASGGPSTRGIVNATVLEALGPKGVLINVSRGSIVDEPALVDALRAGTLGGAGLDVFANEPHIPEALRAMPNVVLAPHMASATVESRQAMAALVLANLQAHFAGTPLLSPLPSPA
jgi:lactate dehydrogenase-like 2-hydroxyacid dehydrogenase